MGREMVFVSLWNEECNSAERRKQMGSIILGHISLLLLEQLQFYRYAFSMKWLVNRMPAVVVLILSVIMWLCIYVENGLIEFLTLQQ